MKKILIVEDVPFNLDLLVQLLKTITSCWLPEL